MIKISFTIFLLFILIFILTSCAPSSHSLRYGKEKEVVIADPDTTIRFTSLNDIQKDYLSESDTLCCGDELSELEDPDDLPADEEEIDISKLISKYGASSNESSLSVEQVNHRERVIMEIIKYMNTPYKFGGNSMNGIDCSAFTQTVFRDALAINLNRSAREQYKQGEVIAERNQLKFGDLVFFNTRRRVRPGHVGIYIGDNLFAHASTKQGVTISSLDHNYYSARYMGARRIENNGLF